MSRSKGGLIDDPGSSPDIHLEVVTSTGGFSRLEEEWDDLYSECAGVPLNTTPFQSWAWLYSWWEHLGEDDATELRISVVRAEDTTVAIMPFMLERGLSMNRLLLLGNGPTSYLDILVRPGWEGAVSGMLDGILASIPGWHVADLQQLRNGSAARAVLGGYSGPTFETRHEDCLVLEAAPWDETVRRLRKSQRSQSRKTIRRVEEDGLTHRQVGATGSEEAARTLVRLNREYWRRSWRSTAPEHWSEGFEEHLVSVTRRLTQKGLGAVSELRGEDGDVVLSQLLLFGNGFTLDFIVSPNPKTLKRYSFNTLFIYYAMKVAEERGSRYLSLMRGSEEYKWRWQPVVESNRRIVLGRSRSRWAIYSVRCAIQSKISDLADSESSPEWLRNALGRTEERRLARQWRDAPPELRRELESTPEDPEGKR